MRTSLLTFALLLLTTGASMAGVLRVGSWSSSGSEPHSSLTAALAAAQVGDEVWVVSNTYREAELTIPAGVSVYGGFTGSETNLSERNYATNVTILDGSGAHRVATVSGLLDGFTLRNGRTGDNGGGAIVRNGGTISHCVLFKNEAGYDGGAVFAEDGGTITNSLFTGNRAGNDGAAVSGARGYRAMNLTVAENLLTGMPVVDALSGVPASLAAGGVLDVAPPAISDDGGSTVLMKGWELDGNAISMPYTVTYADNGKMLRYWAANAVGVGVSAEVALTVTWTVTSSAQLLTPNAVCEGTTLADAGILDPVFSPAPDGGATYTYSIDGTAISGLDYQLQYSDNGKLLTCEIKNNDGSISGATTPAVRLAVMKTPKVILAELPTLSIEESQPLCLPTPVIISNGSDVKTQGWKWTTDGGTTVHDFNSCDKATTAMDNADIYYTAENGCSVTPAKIHFTTLTVTHPVGEFLQTVSALCSNMPLDDCISFADGGNTGDYYIGNTYIGNAGEEGNFTTSWDDVKATALTTAHNLQVLRFSYNGGKNERRMTLTVHAVPVITTDPVTPGAALCLGDAHTLTIEAKGDNLSYQWERSTNSTDGTDGDWDNVPGSTTAACRLTADVSAYYRCTVTGVCIDHSTGVVGNKITSTPAQLTVNDRPVIPDVTFTAGDLKICAGVEISTILGGKAPTLTGTAAIDKGWTLGGVKIADDYKVLSTDNGKVLGYWASNDCGERTATFSTGILAVTSRPELLQSPADVATEENSSVRLSVLTGAGVKYEWYKAGTVAGDPTNGATLIGGATSSSYVFTAEELKGADLTAGTKATEYYCKVIATTDVCKGNNADPTIDPADPAYVLSDVAKVTVSRRTTDITITSQPEAFPETCAGTDKGITVKATGRGNLTCTWYSGSTAMADPANGTIATTVSAIAPTPTNPLAADQELTSTFTPKDAGTYYCIIASTDNPGGVRSTQSVLTIHALPVLTDIPAGERTQTLCERTDLSVKVAASGVDITYEWQKSINGGTTYTAFGETDSRLRTAITGNALYRCVVKATCVDKATGYDPVAGGLVSSPATVTMATKPGIAPAAGFTPSAFSKCEGESIGLVDADVTVTENHKTVAPADCWWTLGGLQVANAYNVTRNDNGKTVGYSATNECGTTAVTFAAMKLTVDEKPQIVQDPVDVQTVENSRVRLSVSASGSNLTYKWQKKAHADANIDANWHDIAGGTNPAYSFTAANITAGAFDGVDVLTDYRCVVGTTNACKATTVTSAPATVTVTRSKSAVSIRRQPAAYEVCNSATAPYAPGFTVEIEGSGHFVYSWYKIGGDGTPVAQTPAGGNLDDAVAAKTNTFQPNAAGTYYCVITSTDDGVGVQTQAVSLTVSQAPVIISITPASATICEGGSVTLGVDATGSALTYQWYQQKGDAPAPATDTPKGTASTYTPVGLASTAKFYCVVGSGSVCTETKTSNSVEVTIEKAPKITTQPVSQSVCGATGIELSVVADNTDTYQWYYNGKTTGTNSATLANVKAGGVYTCVVSKTGGVCGEATTVPALITVADEPKVNLGSRDNLTVCTGDLVTLPSPEIETSGSVIVPEKTGWYVSTEADPTKATLVASFLAGNAGVTYHYKLTYKCAADSESETVLTTADGLPALKVSVTAVPVITGVLKAVAKKEGESITLADIQTTAPVSEGNTLTWTLNDVPVTFNYKVSPADSSKVFRVTATNACGQSTALTSTSTLTVYSAPQILEQPRGTTLCEGTGEVILSVKAVGSHLTYLWMKDGVSVADAAGKDGKDIVAGFDKATLKLTQPAAGRSGVYTCKVSGKGGDPVISAPAIVTVNTSLDVSEITADRTTVCPGKGATLTVSATGDGLVYAWTSDQTEAKVLGTSSTLAVNPAVETVYTCKVTGSCNTDGISKTQTIKLTEAPVITGVLKAVAKKEGESVTLADIQTTAPVSKDNTLTWTLNDVPVTFNYKVSPADSSKVFRVTATNACGQSTTLTSTSTLTVYSAPQILEQPRGTTLCEGTGAVILSVKAVGSHLTYQWMKDGVNVADAAGKDGKDIVAGFDKATLTLTKPAAGRSGVYTCKVSGTGGDAVISAPAVVTVNTSLAVSDITADRAEVCPGKGATLTVSATGDGLVYAWTSNKTAAKVLGTSSTLAVNPAVETVYTCKVTGSCNPTGISKTQTIKLTAVPEITGVLKAVAKKEGESVTLADIQTTAPVSKDNTLTWTLNDVPVTFYYKVSPADSSKVFRVTATNACGQSTTLASTSTLTVYSAPQILEQPRGTTLCEGTGAVILSVKAVGSALTYQWMKDGAEVKDAPGKDGKDIVAGAKTATLKLTKPAVGSSGVYTCKVSGKGGDPVISAPAVVTVNANVAITSEPKAVAICAGNAVTLQVEAVGAASYQWQNGSTNIADAKSASLTVTAAGTYQCVVTGVCGTATSTGAQVTVNNPVKITKQPKDEVKCATDAFTDLSVTATGTAPTYQWYKDNVSQSDVTGDTYAVGQNAGVYHCVVSNACGTATSAPATLTRHAALAATAYADKSALCGSEATIVGVNVTAGAAVSYQWDKADKAITNATLPNMAVVGEDGTAAATRDYTCTVTDVCGKTVTPNVSITHNPVPKITAQPVGGDVCDATKALSITATGAKNATSYQWYKGSAPIDKATTASYTVPNAVGNYAYYCVVTSDQCGSVTSASVHVNIEQVPAFASTTALTTTYAGCGGDQITLPAIPDYTANGSTITGGRWVYGSSSTALGSTWQSGYNNQALYYQVSYKGVCSATVATVLSVQQGTLKWANFASNDVPSSLIAGKFYTMMDTRDRKIYRIKRLSNNQVWMVQNLDYGTCTGTYNTVNSQGNTQGITGTGGDLLYGVCRSSADYGSAPKDNGETYKYYNWQGAMQDEGAVYNTSTDKSEWSNKWQGICPNGWHLPTKDENQTMYNAVGSKDNLVSTADNNASSWAGVLGGRVDDDGSFGNATSYGYYWSSSYSSTGIAYGLYFNSSGTVYPQGTYRKSRGFAVRCLKN